MNRRLLRAGVIAAVAVAVLAVSVLLALPQIVRRVAVWQLAATTGRTVTLDAVEIELFKGRFALRGLRVIDRDQGPLATIERLDARFSPRALLRGHLRVLDGTLRAPTVRIVRTGPREFNISDLLARKTAGGRPPAITLQRFRLVDGAVVIEDRTVTPMQTWRVEVALDARDASTVAGTPPGAVTLNALVAGAPVTLTMTDLTLAPLHLRASLVARGIDAALSGLLLPAAGALAPPRGTVSAKATIEHDVKMGTLIALEAGFTEIELRRTGEVGAFLSAPSVRVTVDGLRARPGAVEVGRVVVDGGTMMLQDARLAAGRRWQVDGVALEATRLSSARDAPPGIARAGATMAGAQVSVWAGNIRLAPLELDVTTIVRNVDLALLRIYLPPALPVQPERGVVNATIRTQYDEGRGTRVALDAGMTGIELRRPNHFVAAPAARVTATDITLDRGAVTVGQVAVTGDRLTLEDRSVTPARTWVVQNLAAEAKSLSSRRQDVQGVATLRATIAGATVSAFVTRARIDPLELYATTILRDVDVALVRLYLPDDAPVVLERGVVNGSVQVEHTLAAGTRVTGDATLTGLQARGGSSGPLSTLAVKSPSVRVALAEARRRGTDLSVGHVELTGSGSLADTRAAAARVDLVQLRIAGDGLTWPARGPQRVELSARFGDRGELDASGSVQLTAPLPMIAWTGEATLRFKGVDVTPLAAVVPAASGLAGRVRGSLTANAAYGASLTAHVRGDAGGARFALTDGSRTLVSARRVDVTGLDMQWPERVSIGELRVFQPYALLERDRGGVFPLAARFARRPADAGAPAAADAATPESAARPATPDGAARATPAITVGEVVVESGSAVVVDESGATRTRIELPRVALTVRDFTWPSLRPATIALDAGFADGGSVTAQGAVRAEPLSVDLTVALKDTEVSPLPPYLGLRASARARVDAAVTVTGPLAPVPRLIVRGEGGARGLTISDGPRPVLTVQEIRATGIDAVWPERVTLDRVRVRRSWALIERDRQGQFLLRTLLGRAETGTPRREPSGPPPAPAAATAFTVRELILEEQGATIVDGVTTPPARMEVAGARLTAQDLTWPSRGPMKVDVATPMPAGGRLNVIGTLDLEPFRLDARAVLDDVAVDPAQPYLPFEGRVAGHVTGELALKLALEPVSLQATGQTVLRAFRFSDGDRPVVTVGRVEAAGIDVDWPRRITVGSVLFRRPRLLIERDAKGDILLRRLATPHWGTPVPGGAGSTGGAPAPSVTSPALAAAPPTIEIATFRLERASARFVDQTTEPDYAEELSEVEMTFTGLTTAPGRRARFTGGGAVGGGTFKLAGEASQGERPMVEFKLDLRDFIIPRANPYIDRFTAWTATQGRFDVVAAYTVNGTQIDARHEVVVHGLEVERVDDRDEVERRLGLPFGFLVSLLKDRRGEIRLSLPVSGDIGTREFDFEDAVWSAVRSVAIRLLALPFSRIGSLFFSEDSKVEAVAIAPVVFEPGSTRLGPDMAPHVERIATFLRGAPSVSAVLKPILTQDDVIALRKEQPADPPPADALRDLGAGRLEVVRQALARAGGVDAARLKGNAPRTPLVESGGAARVEFDLR